jgi:hypothetical protein
MTKKAEEIDTIDKYVNQFHLEHKCGLCDGIGETECDNCGGIGFVPCSPHEVDLLLRKYSREQFTLLNATIASLRSELESVKKENESLKEIEVLYSKILDGINKHQAAVRKPR